MKNSDLAQGICKALEKAERDSRNNIYILKSETVNKINILTKALADTENTIDFDRATNSIEITLTGNVFDSCITNLKDMFQIVDLLVIDALSDGKVCIEMKIINAAKILRRA